MALNQKQSLFVSKCQQTASTFVDVVRDMQILADLWADEFSSGKGNEILDADIADLGIDTGDLASIAVTSGELDLFWTNSQVTARQNGKFMRALLNQYL